MIIKQLVIVTNNFAQGVRESSITVKYNNRRR